MAILTVLHTNDIHGEFDQMTRLASLIARERASAAREGRAVLLLDAGDSSDISAWESRVTKGRANFAMLEAMGYDAVAIGNGDMQWDRDALAKLVGSVHFPALAANLLALDSDQPPAPGLRSHALFNFGELKVAVIGVTVDEPGLYDDWGYRIESVETTARGLVSRLRADGAQVVIVLSHEGVEADQQLAAAVMGIDAAIGGHSHTALLKPIRIGGTVIAQAGALGRYLGRIDLAVEDGKMIASTSRLIPCNETVPPDPTLSGVLELVRFEADVVRRKASGRQVGG